MTVGWTLLNVFNEKYGLNAGYHKLPIYKVPKVTKLEVKDVNTLEKLEKNLFCFRICYPLDQISLASVTQDCSLSDYTIPILHQ